MAAVLQAPAFVPILMGYVCSWSMAAGGRTTTAHEKLIRPTQQSNTHIYSDLMQYQVCEARTIAPKTVLCSSCVPVRVNGTCSPFSTSDAAGMSSQLSREGDPCIYI